MIKLRKLEDVRGIFDSTLKWIWITFLTSNFYFKEKSIDLKYEVILVRALKWTIFYIEM